MKKQTVLALCLIVAVALAAGCSGKKKAAEGPKYETYTSAAHKFSVETPPECKDFETESSDTAGPNGAITTTAYSATCGNMAMIISVTPLGMDLPEKIVADMQSKARDAVGKSGTVISKGEGKLAGKPALTLRYKADIEGTDAFYDGRFAFINGTQYQILFAAMSEKGLDDPAGKHLFESFKLISGAEAAKKAAPAAKEGSGGGGGDYTFAALCAKMVDETKATVGAAYPAAAEKQVREGCMKAEDTYKAMPNSKNAMTAFTKHILTACEGKTKQDWLTCYSNEAAAAAQAASQAATK